LSITIINLAKLGMFRLVSCFSYHTLFVLRETAETNKALTTGTENVPIVPCSNTEK
jgi:hypothetical protein